MLLRNYKAEIVLPRCDPGRETLSLIGHLASAASLVFPYLNATQPCALFNPRAPALRFRFEGAYGHAPAIPGGRG